MISSFQEATPQWLTTTLQASGVLSEGSVVAAELRANDAFNSTISHLTLQYSADAPADLPTHLLLKLNRDHYGEGEIPFYQAAMRQRPPNTARCFAAEYDAASGESYLLLEDLSKTHVTPVNRQQVLALQAVPDEQQLNGMIDALAAFHAYWWEHEQLGKTFIVRPWYTDVEHYQRHIERRQREWAKFAKAVGDEIPNDMMAIYEKTLAKLPQLWDAFLETRITALKNITLTNGDCYFAQFLCPKPNVNAPAYLIDFQDATANFGPYDLVYMFATFWTAEQRSANGRERKLLKRYHQALVNKGVQDYSLDEMLTDYRFMIVLMIFDAVFNATSGSTKDYWMPKMQCLISAYNDWDCGNLIDRL